ncbi:hypothetical protein SAMN05216312_112104 [Cohnella sp. OV330]|uniref:hypothetical protein n=1 Tax=Cohnella sp. OV330 TaxID=1855288 RepID=UPI0008F12CF1|nr:hypothetical protein [Cohnella sp. OV330]SFB54028.1 hypothetical protein SAMN05216312_112104 [Cohnella sp. OV330]
MVYAFVIEPASYIAFADEAEQLDKLKEWDLVSEKATKAKTFYYKGNGLKEVCGIVGYVDHMTAVIELPNKQKHCIHPSYLKEMQAANFGQRFASAADSEEAGAEREETGADPAAVSASPATEIRPSAPASAEDDRQASDAFASFVASGDAAPAVAAAPAKAKAGAARSKKVQLPEEKVKLTATVKEFTTVPNHFADNDDEVIIYESVTIADTETELGEAWSSHSATLKKLELEAGDKLTFEAKVVAKKLAKHPIPYKINNPAKIVKV